MKEDSTEESGVDVGKTSAETKHQRPHRAGHVSFSPSVIERPATSRVTVVEEHGVYIDAFGRRSTIDGEIGNNNGGDAVRDIPSCAIAAGKERVSRTAAASAGITTQRDKGHVGFAIETSSTGKQAEAQSSDDVGGDDSVQYDSLTINLGLLKCGYRYQTVVPIHGQDGKETDSQSRIVEIGESLDPDLQVEATHGPSKDDTCMPKEEDSATDTSTTPMLRDHIQIRIATRRPGKYQASLSVIATIKNQGSVQKSKHIVSVRVKATLLGKDQGKPQLKTNITKLGKLVGYDSDEETEWQGFPESGSEDETHE